MALVRSELLRNSLTVEGDEGLGDVELKVRPRGAAHSHAHVVAHHLRAHHHHGFTLRGVCLTQRGGTLPREDMCTDDILVFFLEVASTVFFLMMFVMMMVL